jgi:hypothetical protein
MDKNTRTAVVHTMIRAKIDEICALFKYNEGQTYLGTVILRDPRDPKADILVTCDTIDGIQEVLGRCESREPTQTDAQAFAHLQGVLDG